MHIFQTPCGQFIKQMFCEKAQAEMTVIQPLAQAVSLQQVNNFMW